MLVFALDNPKHVCSLSSPPLSLCPLAPPPLAPLPSLANYSAILLGLFIYFSWKLYFTREWTGFLYGGEPTMSDRQTFDKTLNKWLNTTVDLPVDILNIYGSGTGAMHAMTLWSFHPASIMFGIGTLLSTLFFTGFMLHTHHQAKVTEEVKRKGRSLWGVVHRAFSSEHAKTFTPDQQNNIVSQLRDASEIYVASSSAARDAETKGGGGDDKDGGDWSLIHSKYVAKWGLQWNPSERQLQKVSRCVTMVLYDDESESLLQEDNVKDVDGNFSYRAFW